MVIKLIISRYIRDNPCWFILPACVISCCNFLSSYKREMSDDYDKLLFRLQHLIPQGLSSAAPKLNKTDNNNNVSSKNCFEEVEFQMTYGRVAGT